MQKYCDHGGRYLMWLPFQVTDKHIANVIFSKTRIPGLVRQQQQ